MDADDEIFMLESLTLESGLVLPHVQVAYRTWGTLNERGDNVIFIAHALTGNADARSWWSNLFGEDHAFDESKYFIVCANMLGSCYGTTGPLDRLPRDPAPEWVRPRKGTARAVAGDRYAGDFPYCTIRDTVALHRELLHHLGVKALHAVVGGSAGGMQALEWLLMYPDLVQRAVVLACGASQHAWQIGISESQRQAIYRDTCWNDGFYSLEEPPADGLSVARQQAMIWYRSQPAYDAKFGRAPQAAHPGGAAAQAQCVSGGGGVGAAPTYAVEGYLEHQGTKFVRRFDAGAYVALTRAIDSHDVGRGRGGVAAALSAVRAPVLVVGLTSDVLYPIEMQRALASGLRRGTLHVVPSEQGHDGFLLETKRIGAAIRAALEAEHEDELQRTASALAQYASDEEEGAMDGRAYGSACGRADERADGDHSTRSQRETMKMPRTRDAMNAALATSHAKLSPTQQWYFGI